MKDGKISEDQKKMNMIRSKSVNELSSEKETFTSNPSFTSSGSLTLFAFIYDHYQRLRHSRYFIAGLHHFLSGMRVILERFYQFSASYSNQYDLHYRWRHIYTRQENEWDCGVACCAMVLKWANLPSSLIYQHEIALRGTPLWTLDLLLYLTDYKLNATMFTTSLGVQSHHENYEWYKQSLEQDRVRMNKQLDRIQCKGLNIVEGQLDIREIQHMLLDERKSIAIILIDSLTFAGIRSSQKYLGHYILLLKYDPAVDEFYYFNPAIASGLQKVTSKRLNEARLHPATDGDLIIINRSK